MCFPIGHSPHMSHKYGLTGWQMKEDLFESWFGTWRKRSKMLFILRLGKMNLFVTSPLKVLSCLHNFAEGWVCKKQMLTSVPQVVFCEQSKLRKQRCCQMKGFTSPLHPSCGLPLVLSWQPQNLWSHGGAGAGLGFPGLTVPGLVLAGGREDVRPGGGRRQQLDQLKMNKGLQLWCWWKWPSAPDNLWAVP